MHHLIIGYGYCGFYLAAYLLKQGQKVTAFSRHLDPSMQLDCLNYYQQDISNDFNWTEADTLLYYFVPPPSSGIKDTVLQQFLASSKLAVKKIIYCSSSAVYGEHQGNWIDELAACHLVYDRQKRRLDAEQQWQQFCCVRDIEFLILRVAGIYGPGRLPVQAAKEQAPLIRPDRAPYSNHIYVKDLARISALLAQQDSLTGIFNLADGVPLKMGSLQSLTAQQLGFNPAPYASFEELWQLASPMKREFMSASKRLRIGALETTLKQRLQLTTLEGGIIASLKDEGQ